MKSCFSSLEKCGGIRLRYVIYLALTYTILYSISQVQAEPLMAMGSLARLLLVAGGFLGAEDWSSQGRHPFPNMGCFALPSQTFPNGRCLFAEMCVYIYIYICVCNEAGR